MSTFSRRWRMSSILLLVAVAVGYGIVVRVPKPSGRSTDVDEAVGVLHVRSVRTSEGVSTLHEAWSDLETGDVAYKAWGVGGTLLFHGVQRGPLLEQYWPADQRLLQESGLSSDVEGLPLIGGELLRYRVLVNGEDTRWRITDRGTDLWRLEGTGEALKIVVWVDPTWYLPVREEWSRPRDESVERVAWEHEMVEIVGRDAVDGEGFRIDAVGVEPHAR